MAKKLSYKELFSNLKGLTVRSVVPAELGWAVEAEGSSSALCPDCGVTSHSRHSRYWRKLRDLPLQRASVTLKVQMGRWRCRSRRLWLPKTPSELETRKSRLHADTLCRRN